MSWGWCEVGLGLVMHNMAVSVNWGSFYCGCPYNLWSILNIRASDFWKLPYVKAAQEPNR